MATLILGAAGAALGGSLISGTILGLTGAAIGGFIGASIGSVVDSWIISSLAPGQRIEGARLDSLRLTSSTEGAVIPRVSGRMRMGGNIIWATDFREEVRTTTQRVGGKGGGGSKVTTTEYLYYASFAVALTEGPISGIGRIWADGKPMDTTGVTWRWYPGDESQARDPFIAAKMGAANTPAYRGTAYVVFEDLPLESYGNRLPQLSFEVFRPVADPDSAEGMIRAMVLGDGMGEFGLATRIVTTQSAGTTAALNASLDAGAADFTVALDRLQAACPGLEAITLPVAWFGDDLRANTCQIRPGVETRTRATTPLTWGVNGETRSSAHLLSRGANGVGFRGTPSDQTVIAGIREIKARGLRVTLAPVLMLDIPASNTRINPWTGAAPQPAYAAATRITASLAPGLPGSPDLTAAMTSEITTLFGAATPAQFAVSGETVRWNGPASDRGLRRLVLHYAYLAARAGGVDAFLLGPRLDGLITLRSDPGTYPATAQWQNLAAAVRQILGAGTEIGFAAGPETWHSHHAAPGEVRFPLDPLWADANVDFIGVEAYWPLADWRDGDDHLDAAQWPAPQDRSYLAANVAGGDGYDWRYLSDADRAAQRRTPVVDLAGGVVAVAWLYRPKDLVGWWSNAHVPRVGGVAQPATAWIPRSKPIRFTAFGAPAVDRAANEPDELRAPLAADARLPWFSRGWRDDVSQRSVIEALLGHWSAPGANPVSPQTGALMLDVANSAAAFWDTRPYPAYPEAFDLWPDATTWRTGHNLSGRLGSVSLAALVRSLCLRGGLPDGQIDVSGLWGAVEGHVITALESPRTSITVLARHFGFDAVESEGRIRFLMRGRAPAAVISAEDMVTGATGGAEVFELTRAQETELPLALKWQIARADEDYDSALVEARRVTVTAARITAEAFPMAVPPEEAERRCRRALMEAWTGRESAAFRLPPSRLALDPGDVLRFNHDGREIDLRILSLADSTARGLEALVQDRTLHDLPPGAARPAALARPLVFGAPEVAFLDLPQLTETEIDHQPLIAGDARPWPGTLAVWRSASSDGFSLIQTLGARARMGVLAEDLGPGPVARFDYANALVVDLASGTLESVTDLALFGGANALTLETGPGLWEIIQAGTAELVAPGRYRLTRLLRGQRGTEQAMGNPTLAGARIVLLDATLARLPIPLGDLGLPWLCRVGPAALPFTDPSFAAAEFTPTGTGLRPFAVAQVEEPSLRGRIPGDLTLRWIRSDRALVADSWEAVEVPMSEAREAYAVEIMGPDGTSVVRVLSANQPQALYSAADQIADRGALLGPGDSLTIRIFQLSALLGRGAPRIVTLSF